MTLPDYITRYLRNPLICPRQDRITDPLATWTELGMHDGARDLARWEIAMLIEDETGCPMIADDVIEKWETLADVAEAAMWFEGVVV